VGTAQVTALDAEALLASAALAIEMGTAAFPNSDLRKLLVRGTSGYGRLVAGLFAGKEARYFKSLPKTAATLSDAISAMASSP
jgi:hypothetical protein